uniref:RecD helicase /ATP-dependent exoDNAse n=1 Tax=Pithovirus LCPAC101 TaxID=2506586 RepID=A0A481Z2V4_9VIRU|nr:MAG: RecD helicase /ATP-dependent exoDNAse [Pithovirus LCPAC101]
MDKLSHEQLKKTAYDYQKYLIKRCGYSFEDPSCGLRPDPMANCLPKEFTIRTAKDVSSVKHNPYINRNNINNRENKETENNIITGDESSSVVSTITSNTNYNIQEKEKGEEQEQEKEQVQEQEKEREKEQEKEQEQEKEYYTGTSIEIIYGLSLREAIIHHKRSDPPSGKRVLGRIDKIYYNKKCITIKQAKTYEIFRCTYDGFFAGKPGDSILAYLVKGSRDYAFDIPPYVDLSMDEESIITCIIEGRRPKRTTKKYADTILKHWKNHNDNLKYEGSNYSRQYIHDYISNISYLSSKDMLDPDVSYKFNNNKKFMNEGETKKFLNWWYKQRILRRLWMYGLTNTEIKDSNSNLGLNPIDLYDKLMKEPFYILSISIDKCKDIYWKLQKTYSDDALYFAGIARTIYDRVKTNGWTSYPNKYLIRNYVKLRPTYGNKLEEFINEYKVIVDKKLGVTYLPFTYDIETSLVNHVYEIHTRTPDLGQIKPIYDMKTLDDKQKSSIVMSLNSNISIITGGAGTGKTTVIKEIVSNLERLGSSVVIVSFTGKAVARLKEVLQNNAPSTMHMMIRKKNKQPKFDHLIIDEVSMITYKLMYQFISAFGINYKITLVGDQNQLPPIGWGNFFSELMKADKIHTTILTNNHRSKMAQDGSINGIYTNSQKIIDYVEAKRNLYDPSDFVEPVEFQQHDNFVIIPTKDSNSSINVITKCAKNLNQCGMSAHDITIISPFTADLPEINRLCQEVFNSSDSVDNRIILDGIIWRVGDRVMMTENNYGLDVMNGDEGTITSMKLPVKSNDMNKMKPGEITVKFKSGKEAKFIATNAHPDDEVSNVESDILEGEKYVNREKNTVACLVHAYAITVHRSQGSEWDCVLFYFPHRPKSNYGLAKFLNYHLIYTGITRAKKIIFCVGDIPTMFQATMNYPGLRHDNFCERFISLLDE